MSVQVVSEQIKDLAIVTAKLAANAVTAAKAKLDEVWTFTSLPECSTLPTTDHQFANKEYVDSLAAGLDVKASVHAATATTLENCTYSGTPNFTLTKAGNGALPAQDGQTLTVGQRLLVKLVTVGGVEEEKYRGIYVVTTVGDAGTPWVLTRAADMNTSAEFDGAFTFVEKGTTLAATGWVCTTATDPFVLDTDDLSWSQFSAAAAYTEGNGIDITGSVISAVGDATKAGVVGVSGIGVSLETNHGLGYHATSGSLEVLVNAAKAMVVGASGLEINLEANHGLGFHATSYGIEIIIEASKGLSVGASGLAGVANAAAAMAVGASGFGVAIEADHGLGYHATSGSLEVLASDTSINVGSGGIKVNIADYTLVTSSGLKVYLQTGGGLAVDANGVYCQRLHEAKTWSGTGNTFVLAHTPADTPTGYQFLIVTLNGLVQFYDGTPEQGEYSISTGTITMGGYTDVPAGYKTEVWYIGW